MMIAIEIICEVRVDSNLKEPAWLSVVINILSIIVDLSYGACLVVHYETYRTCLATIAISNDYSIYFS